MNKKVNKRPIRNTVQQEKVDVFLVVPKVLHEWLWDEAQAGGFKNVQAKILDVLRAARESSIARAA